MGNLEGIVLVLLCIFFGIQLFYQWFFFARMMTKEKVEVEKTSEVIKPVSVIICARNEERNITKNLPKVIEQLYPEFQIVVINDRSWDSTQKVIEGFVETNKNITLVNIPVNQNDGYAKKFALTVGIKAAKHEHLVFIDADCSPTSQNWLREMAKQFTSKKSIVLGASGFEKEKGFLNKIIRYDGCQIALQYLSFAKARLPYMGVGRNLGYTNELYNAVRGFKSHYHIPSGDDDLFVNEAANGKNTAISFSPESITITPAKSSFKEWVKQKRRHMTTGKRYRFIHKLLLTGYPLSYLSFLVISFIFVILHDWWYIAFGMIGVRIIFQWITCSKAFNTLNSRDLITFAPLYEIILLFITPFFWKQNNAKP